VFVELPCEITTPLVDQETQENETISLVLVISKPRKVTWSKNGQEVVASDRFQISVSEDGLRHVLTLKGVTKDEMAEYTASIDDASHGIITSWCKVTVNGKSVIILVLSRHRHHRNNKYKALRECKPPPEAAVCVTLSTR